MQTRQTNNGFKFDNGASWCTFLLMVFFLWVTTDPITGYVSALAKMLSSRLVSLGLITAQSQIVFMLIVLTAIVDCGVYVCLRIQNKSTGMTAKANLWNSVLFKLQLTTRVILVPLTCVPLLAELNTDFSLASLFYLSRENPMINLANALTLFLSFFLGLAALIKSRQRLKGIANPNKVETPIIQASAKLNPRLLAMIPVAGLILSDVPMFAAAYMGYPMGLLQNACVNMLVMGLLTYGYVKHYVWLETKGILVSTSFNLGFGADANDHELKQPLTTNKELLIRTFGFLSLSRLTSWWLAYNFGPSKACGYLSPNLSLIVALALALAWVFSARSLWMAACRNTSYNVVLPLEPWIAYNVCAYDFLVTGFVAFKLKRRMHFRTSLKALKRFTRGFGKTKTIGAYLNALLRVVCRRYAFLAILTFGLPSVIQFYGINAVEKQQITLSFDTVAKMTLASPKESLARTLLPSAVAALATMLGAGLGATRLIGQHTQANVMADKCDQLEAEINQLDTNNLSESGRILHGRLLAHAEHTKGVVLYVKRSNITNVTGNEGQIGENHLQAGQLLFATNVTKPETDADVNIVAMTKNFLYSNSDSVVLSDVTYYLEH